jgi:exodeoxyribonuclease-5
MSEITLTNDQAQALKAIKEWLINRTTVQLTIGGYAGTGKTTLIAYLRKELAEKNKKSGVAFCSYTGKAASVLRNKLREVQALLPGDSCSTIHSLIYRPVLDGAGQIISWDRAPTLPYELIIIDEGSMVNATIWQDLLRFNLPILVFGDHGQLPPIEGSFNLMHKPDIRLEHIVRQAEDNPIIHLSKQVREGHDIPFGTTGGLVKKYALSDYEAMEVFEGLMSGSDEDYLCLCGINKTRVGLNKRVRALKEFDSPEPMRGDRVICLRNNHAKAIYNGMIGKLKSIEPEEEHWYSAEVDFESFAVPYSGKVLRYQFGQPATLKAEDGMKYGLNERQYGDLFDFGYALTCHKAQGSEARRVILFEERMRFYDEAMWRRWLYTAITRAREELYIFA